jgi:hypothetical protein
MRVAHRRHADDAAMLDNDALVDAGLITREQRGKWATERSP